MKSFDEIYQIVEESSHETAFNREEAKAVYDILASLDAPSPTNIVEIGVQFGRSTTIFAEVCKKRPHWHFTAIDNWCEEEGARAKAHVESQMEKHGWRFDLWTSDSSRAAEKYDRQIDVLHIDGDHTYQGVRRDLLGWMHKVKIQGYALFDDYGHKGLEDVARAVDQWMIDTSDEQGWCRWHYMGRYGDKLGVFRRIA